MTERSTGGKTTRYYYDDRGLLVAEGTVSSTGTVQITTGYVHDATGKLTARQMAGESQLQSYVTNGHGDVTEIRDASGNVLNRYTYDIWGNPETAEETVPNVLRYAGKYWDEVTDLQYLRARWYDPSTARFISEDTYEGELTNPLSLNLYTYVENNPLNYVDPTGHRAWLIHGTFSDADTWTPDFVKYVEGLFNESSKALEWTGKNSKGARSDAAEDLVKTVYEWHSKNPDEPIRLVGHSHGGNVAIMLANLLEKKGMKVETLITVATPVREYKLKTKVGQHIHMYNNRDSVQGEMGGSWWWAGSSFTRKFKGADNVRAKDGEIGTKIQAHSTMHSNVDVWKKYIEPILKLK
ncbi:RHS repeat-associated core domain-containing protein [Paenibacillus sp. QZ-Y1]|uniref:RHS repeat-associated core domain-containing protein n=1 Tax=Paenibacillus sp. QZ-Y1 TaxID=3414511 RepID=UPI003F7A6695